VVVADVAALQVADGQVEAVVSVVRGEVVPAVAVVLVAGEIVVEAGSRVASAF
jgi:hypothetical protein